MTPEIKALIDNIYLFKVQDYNTILLGRYHDGVYYIQRGDGVKYEYESYRVVWAIKLQLTTKKNIMTPEEKASNRTRIILMIIACVIWLSFSTLLFFTSCSKPSDPITPERPALYKSTAANLMPNMGGAGTQDFDAKADTWQIRSGKGGIRSNSIYFAGNYLHVEARSQFSLISPKPTNKTGWQEYTLTFKYRSTVPVNIAVKYADNCTWRIGTMPATDKVQRWTTRFNASRVDWVKWYNKAPEAGWMEIDEIELL